MYLVQFFLYRVKQSHDSCQSINSVSLLYLVLLCPSAHTNPSEALSGNWVNELSVAFHRTGCTAVVGGVGAASLVGPH